MDRKLLAKKQRKILKYIYNCGKIQPIEPINGVLRRIKELGPEEACLIFANLGKTLYELASVIDLENPHPDLYKFLDGDLVNDNPESFNVCMCNTLNILPSIASIKLREYLVQFVKSHFSSIWVQENLLGNTHNRFIEDAMAREKSRNNKTVQTFWADLSSLSFLSEINDFADYIRGNNVYNSYIQQATKKIEVFEKYGLMEMVADITKSIDELKETNQNSQHFGFNYISLNDASIISAKVNELIFNQEESRVRIPVSVVEEFFTDTRISPFIGLKGLLDCIFSLYPLHEWLELKQSEQMDKLIAFLEQYPECNNKAVFDRFWVLVPCLDFASYRIDGFYDFECNTINNKLIQSDKIIPILLGEKDGMHYFISYWT